MLREIKAWRGRFIRALRLCIDAQAPRQGVRRFQFVLMQSLHAWINHRADSKGAALAFYTLFSMTPILVLAIAVAGYFFGAEAEA